MHQQFQHQRLSQLAEKMGLDGLALCGEEPDLALLAEMKLKNLVEDD